MAHAEKFTSYYINPHISFSPVVGVSNTDSDIQYNHDRLF